ncbi:DUF1360 domain-containing protein [Sandaracinus amylolyticus]|uniref:Integral membrane protein n=1 Tax=Sandaracinus amylolyticus TaxID=927083 RepID=A0A0F6WA76_9BACT|nr:DUF1360 domain-containing protein [Sandaracinus amylolyticus]AKF11387.1 hypothetical protein DB32_008536 [Sandaracinus amylolyticus]
MDNETICRDLRRHHVIGRGHDHEPLVDYAVLATTFLTVTSTAVVSALRRDALPRELPLRDALLLGLATTRLTRLFTREKVMRVVRAPFTEVEEGASPDEVKERPRGDGAIRALGELLTCPRCFGMWSSAALSIAYVFAPGPTRFAAGLLTAALVNDYVNLRFAQARAHQA